MLWKGWDVEGSVCLLKGEKEKESSFLSAQRILKGEIFEEWVGWNSLIVAPSCDPLKATRLPFRFYVIIKYLAFIQQFRVFKDFMYTGYRENNVCV